MMWDDTMPMWWDEVGEIFHLIFLDYCWLWETDTLESETTDKGAYYKCFSDLPFSGDFILKYMKRLWMHVLHNEYLIDWWEKTKLSFYVFYCSNLIKRIHLFCPN